MRRIGAEGRWGVAVEWRSVDDGSVEDERLWVRMGGLHVGWA